MPEPFDEDSRRALILHENSVLVDMGALSLNHRVFRVGSAETGPDGVH